MMDVERWLKKRSEDNQGTTLFLGARAGGLYRSKTLYSTSKLFSPRTFRTMTQTQQFRECYRVLSDGDFSRGDIDSILVASLQSLKCADADNCLAGLVQSGIFDVIVSTNIDNLLSTAFEESGMKQGEDFQIFIPQQHPPDEAMSYQHKYPSTLIKVSGDLEIGEYNLFRQNFYLETHNMLKEFLTSTLSRAMLMIGYDPFWDRAIDALLPLEGQEIWYVNEESPKSLLLPMLQNRKGKCMVGGEGSYEFFTRKLYWYLGEERSLYESFGQDSWGYKGGPTKPLEEIQDSGSLASPRSEDSPVLHSENAASEKEQRTYVFIGYHRNDERYLKKLKSHMARYEREKLLNVWDDQKVKAGMRYREELQTALNSTKVAILLVSPDFLASDFIASDVLPPLLQAAEKGGAIILPVILRPCVIEGTVLQQYQPFNDPDKPLSSKNAHGKDQVWADLVRYVYVVTLGRDIDHASRSI